MRRDLRQENEDAVTAAVATVLLFAIVLSIISGMMAMIVPTMAELQGAVDRETMEGQFTDLAQETVRLSEAGLPGDRSEMMIQPHTGDVSWNLRRGGTWYTATLVEDQTLRLNGMNDLDAVIEHRYPGGDLTSMCLTDLRAHIDAEHRHISPQANGKLLVTPVASLQTSLERVTVNDGVDTHRIRAGTVIEIDSNHDSPAMAISSMPMRAIFFQGDGGMTTFAPDSPEPTGMGRGWTIPATTGNTTIILYSTETFTAVIHTGDTTLSLDSAVQSTVEPDGSQGRITMAETTITLAESMAIEVTTSTPAHMIVKQGESTSGSTALLDQTGSTSGTNFLFPPSSDELLIHNPGLLSTSVEINGLYHSVGARDTARIAMASGQGGWIVSGSPVQAHIVADGTEASRTASLDYLHSTSTGRTSASTWSNIVGGSPHGSELMIQRLGHDVNLEHLDNIAPSPASTTTINESSPRMSIQWTSAEGGRIEMTAERPFDQGESPVRAYISHGDSGLIDLLSMGEDRCVELDDRISGWTQNHLPWADVSFLSDGGVIDAWISGEHPVGLLATMRGPHADDPHAAVGLGWSIPLPRMDYTFSSSVSGLEIGWRGGFVGTNHPEYVATTIEVPPSREGPGPRIAVTVPVVIPDMSLDTGTSDHKTTLTLLTRCQLASLSAHEVRRGWDGPYGASIASQDAIDLDSSTDWLTYPGRLDLLNDYVGWVQPTPTSTESIYHAGDGPVSFNLQMALIEHDAVVIDG